MNSPEHRVGRTANNATWREVNGMDIPLNAEAECADGPCGHSTHIIIDPTTEHVTHLVIQERDAPHAERLVPVGLVANSAPDRIYLRCSRRELNHFEPLKVQEFVRATVTRFKGGPHLTWPFVMPESKTELLEFESIPFGELAVRRGAAVQAVDGRVGKVDEFLINPGDGHITHLVLRQGHLWDKREVAVPISVIDRIEKDTVYLKLDRHSVQLLPPVSVKR
jgi:sporulation protein YlmC with PRC-barrel domain